MRKGRRENRVEGEMKRIRMMTMRMRSRRRSSIETRTPKMRTNRNKKTSRAEKISGHR